MFADLYELDIMENNVSVAILLLKYNENDIKSRNLNTSAVRVIFLSKINVITREVI